VGYALTASQTFRIQPLIFGVTLAVNTALCATFVPALGLKGAALAWLVAWLTQVLFGLVVLRRRLRHIIPTWTPLPAHSSSRRLDEG
jgi:Na+-driven multidrug efflux pump